MGVLSLQGGKDPGRTFWLKQKTKKGLNYYIFFFWVNQTTAEKKFI